MKKNKNYLLLGVAVLLLGAASWAWLGSSGGCESCACDKGCCESGVCEVEGCACVCKDDS